MPLRAALSAILALTFAAPIAHAAEPPPHSAAMPEREPLPLDLGLRAGFGVRLGEGPALPIASRAGGVLGLGATVSPSRWVGVSLGWEHAWIGAERGAGDLADISLDRAMDVVWASLRLAFVRTERFALLAQLGPGLVFQHLDASVLVYPAVGELPRAASCRASAGPGLGLRAGLGAEVAVGGPFWIAADAIVDHVQASDAPLGECALGVGSFSSVGARLGLVYRFEVGRWLR